MHISLSADCPIFEPSNQMYLARVLGSIVDGWHTLLTPYPEQLEGSLSAETWAIYGEYLSQSFKDATKKVGAIQYPINCESCDPDGLSRYLRAHVLLVVENPRSDGGFIEMVVDALRPRLKGALKGNHRAIEVRHGGGIGEIPAEIERLYHDELRTGPAGLAPRFLVMVDSDAKKPSSPSSDALRVVDRATKLGVDCHVLQKRSIENYLPDDALQAYARVRSDRSGAVAAITSLTGAPRDHYPMKDGLPLVAAGSSEEESLYPLDLPRELGLGNFVVDFLNTSRHHVTRPGITARDQDGDLLLLLDRLERIL